MPYLENLRELLWSLFLAGFSIVQTERVGLWGRAQRPWAYLPVSLAHQVLLLFCFLSAHGGTPSKPSAKLFSDFCFYCLYLFYL